MFDWFNVCPLCVQGHVTLFDSHYRFNSHKIQRIYYLRCSYFFLFKHISFHKWIYENGFDVAKMWHCPLLKWLLLIMHPLYTLTHILTAIVDQTLFDKYSCPIYFCVFICSVFFSVFWTSKKMVNRWISIHHALLSTVT